MARSVTTAPRSSRLKIVRHALGSPEDATLEHVSDQTSPAAFTILVHDLLSQGRKQDASRVKLANVLADVLDDHVDVATAILDDGDVKSTRDLALRYDIARVESMLPQSAKATGGTGPVPVTARTGKNSKVSTVALNFRQRLFQAEPTAVLQQMLSPPSIAGDDARELPIGPSASTRDEMVKFLARHPDFNIRTESVLKRLDQDHDIQEQLDPETRNSVTENLKTLQRTQALTPAPEALEPLLQHGLTSAMRVAALPKKRFTALVSPMIADSGGSSNRAEQLASQIHDHATASRMRADNTLVQLHAAIKGSGLRSIDGQTSLEERQIMAQELADATAGTPSAINLDALFGDMDMCECEECLDVTSPTAYYVDLLQYLRNNNLDPDKKWSNTGKEDIQGTALERLFQRRPDLQYLRLTCANANTPLPMIDLANEVMEAFVINANAFAITGKAVIEAWNVENETTEELLASPSNTRKRAYCILNEAVYPLATLPYFQPLDASRLYLTYLGTSRFELIDTMRLAGRQWPVRAALISNSEKQIRYATMLARVQDRAAAAEYMGLAPSEYIIVTHESFWAIECSEFADNGHIIQEDEYHRDIGLLSTSTYWGFNDDNALRSIDPSTRTGLSFVKAQFLRRSGLSFPDVVDLLHTKYVNPMMPEGKDRILLDSIRFSYRFLQHVTVGIPNASGKSRMIADFLLQAQPWVQYIQLQQIPATGNPLVKPVVDTPTFEEPVVRVWVRKWFDCIGKLIVLESKTEPRLPIQGYLVWRPPSDDTTGSNPSSLIITGSQPRVLGYLDTSGQLTDENSQVVGVVWMDSRVFYGGLQTIRTSLPKGRIDLIQTAKRLTTLLLNNSTISTSPLCLYIWEWERINRFIRLYKKLQLSGWTITTLDAALMGLWKVPEITPGSTLPPGDPLTSTTFEKEANGNGGFSFSDFKDKGCGDEAGAGDCDDGECSDDEAPGPVCDPSTFPFISPGFIKQLMSIQRLADLTGQDLDKLLCLWSDIPTFGERSLYARLFLTHNLQAIDSVFVADKTGHYLSSETNVGEHVPLLLAALHVKAKSFDSILKSAGLTRQSPLDIKTLTRLYRHMVLSSILDIRPEDLVLALDLWPNPYDSASTTLDLYLLWTRISATSFTVPQLRYIIFDAEELLRPIGPGPATVLRTAQALLEGLLSIAKAQPDLTEQEEAVLTMAQVTAKANLLFAPSVVDSIVGLIEGTRLYTTNAPIGLDAGKLRSLTKVIYKDPLTPRNRRATLSVTGSLTDDEVTAAEAIFPSNQEWSAALKRLHRQAEKFVTNDLGAIFAGKIEEAVAVLTQGDVAPVQDTEEVPGTPGTAIQKRVYFMRHFVPYLRSTLESNFIITTVSGVAPSSPDMCSWLLKEVISVGPVGSQASAMSILLALKGHLEAERTPTWNGYLIRHWADHTWGPSMEDSHERNNGNSIKCYDSRPVRGRRWRGAEVHCQGFNGVQGFSLDLTEAQYFQRHGSQFDGVDLNRVSLPAWKRLLQYYELRESLVRQQKGLLDLFKWASLRDKPGTTTSIDELSGIISEVTTWDAASIKVLLAKENFNMSDVKLFQNEVALTRMSKTFALGKKTGISDLSLLLSWTDLKLDFQPTWNLAKSIRQTIQGRYTASDYEQAIKSTHDQLRKNQRNALIAYLLVLPSIQTWGVADADGLFEFFLLDVQMGACMQTSRTKQAISSVQLFVQRCILGLEEKYGVLNDALDADRWKWMSKQTVWTANRKVWLWPENWMIPSLRDDKTPIYTDMESELLQRDVNPTNVLESFKTYVDKLDQIAHLRAVAIYQETRESDKFIFHCVAMTVGSPYLFFYRSYDYFNHEWTPWIRITVDIPTYTIEYSTVAVPRLASEFVGGRGPADNVLRDEASPPAEGARAANEVILDDTAVDFSSIQPKASFTGCYVAPMVWQGRRLFFIGELVQKAVPNTVALAQDFGEMTKPGSTTKADELTPPSIWELKVSWTEYRSGKWTNKQIASEPFTTTPFTDLKPLPVDSFQLMPQIATRANGAQYINIEIWNSHDASYLGNYVFNGSVIQKGTSTFQTKPKNWVSTSFQLLGGRSDSFTVVSLQKSDDGTTLPLINTTPNVAYTFTEPEGRINYAADDSDIFYHPFSAELVSAATRTTEATSIEPIEAVYQTLLASSPELEEPTFGTGASEANADGVQRPTFAELSKPYTNYNWELGFFAPILGANALLTGQQFEEALDMIHHVFNPYADGPDVTRVWKWLPFQKASSKRVLETIFSRLKPRQWDLNITKWRDHPFQPFVVARGRTVSYMKWTVMLYIQALIAYGDMYFRRRTLEDIPLAIQLYVLASHLYGPKGETIPAKGKKIPQTYHSLLNKWDAFSNAAVQLEVAFPFSNQKPFPFTVSEDSAVSPLEKIKQIGLANVFGLATSSYFCLPSNPKLQALRTTIDQRLYNIRNCLDIDGRPMPLALWDAPIDPGELVAAVASGLSLSSALNDLNTSLPNYRFTWLIARALEMTGELKSLEASLLSIKEKRDGEALQMLRTGHELTMNKMILDMKKLQLEEANKSLVALQVLQQSSKARFDFFSRLAGVEVPSLGSSNLPFTPMTIKIDPPAAGDTHLNSLELQEQTQAIIAQFWNGEVANLEIMAGILHALPSFNVHGTPMGCGIEVAWGMPNIAAAFQAAARYTQTFASDSNFSSMQAGRKAGYVKQFQDRVHQMNLAGLEFEHVNSQIATQNTRIAITNQDISNQQKLIDNSQEVHDFLRDKYTNDELYSYLEGGVRTAMYQAYLLAYDMAKKAEQAFRFERRPTAVQNSVDFVSFGYFNPARDGLQSSQQLYLALKRMDTAYQESRGHDYELTKAISLRQLNPYQLLTLRETGSCTFNVPEVAFDADFPGHFHRRIRTASLTIPCVAGPYTGINATLRLLKHRYRADARATSARDYVEDTSNGGLDARFRSHPSPPVDTVALSSAQNDSGLTLPPAGFRPFDYASIADVVLSLRYVASEGGEALGRAAAGSVLEWMGTVEEASKEVGLLALLDVRAEFAAEWAKLAVAAPSATNGQADVRSLVLRQLQARLPAFVAGRDAAKVRVADVSLVTNLGFTEAASLGINLKYVGGSGGTSDQVVPFDSGPVKIGGMNMFRIATVDATFGDWALQVSMSSAIKVDGASRLWLIVRYKLVR
ncbi:uncharacterized protein AB675_5621 [Cyphellophora attinorum]|uniref:Uncharacterized protein n=1 Tax=Cyphellophora attinorum TaxID=1664694 RepID=A0A0N1HC84_9EURO|nr:uncharacterized protein AB675_5621 [Phialophora attinorum]KPI41866.1 hypothetical protein AB675_5621 [Phialophora attinorum]